MSRQFSIPTVLRMVPNYLLRPFFKNLGHGPCEIDFDHLSEREVEPMVAAIVDLPRPDQDFFEGVLRSIFDMGCEAGMQSLLEAAEKCGQYDFAAQLPEDGSCYEKAMWAWLYHKEVFDKALQFHQVAHLSWWRKRCDLPQRTPDLSPATLQQLAEDLASFLEEIFSQTVLGEKLGFWEPRPAYELNVLKDRQFVLATDPEDQIKVSLRKMRLSLHGGRRILLEITEDHDDLYRMIEECLKEEHATLFDVNITSVTLRFEMLPLEGRKTGTMTFDVAFPNHCGLRNHRPERIELAQKYLKRWGIDVAQSTADDFDQVGV